MASGEVARLGGQRLLPTQALGAGGISESSEGNRCIVR